MNRKEIEDIITLSGIGGLEKEIKKDLLRNDRWWAIAIGLISIFWAGTWVLDRQNTMNKIQQFKYDYAAKVGKQYGIAMDSLVKIYENNGIENCIVK